MTTLPTGTQLVAAANVSAMQGLMSDQATAISEMPGGAAATTLTIAAGQVTPTVACHLVDTEAAAASDDLTNIVTTNHIDGRRLLISMVDAARIVTIKHNAGGAGQIALVNGYDLVLKVGGWVELKRTGANWEEVGRSQNLVSTVQLSGPVNESYATVASHATTADIWSAKGNVINFTGTAVVTAFPAAPQAGVRRRLICAGACSFTDAAGFVVDGGSYTAAAGDVVDVESVSTTSFKLHPLPVGGTLSKSGNLSGLASAATARSNLGLGTAAVLASDTDTELAADSDTRSATQKAVKSFVGSAWTPYTPTVTAQSGTFTSVSGAGRYKQIGKTVYVTITVTVTTVGTAAGFIAATLPVAAVSGSTLFILTGQESSATGKACRGTISIGSSQVNIAYYDNTFPGASGNTVTVTGTYEAA